jgi:hypothetical protein
VADDDTTANPQLQQQIALAIEAISVKAGPYSGAMLWAYKTALEQVLKDPDNLGDLRGLKNGAPSGPPGNDLMALTKNLVDATDGLAKLSEKLGKTTDAAAQLMNNADLNTSELAHELQRQVNRNR